MFATQVYLSYQGKSDNLKDECAVDADPLCQVISADSSARICPKTDLTACFLKRQGCQASLALASIRQEAQWPGARLDQYQSQTMYRAITEAIASRAILIRFLKLSPLSCRRARPPAASVRAISASRLEEAFPESITPMFDTST